MKKIKDTLNAVYIFVALRGTPGALGVLWPRCSCSMAVFRQF